MATSRDSRQVGFSAILPEEAPLASEVMLSGGVLHARLREANAALRSILFDGRPDDITPEEWRVVTAHLISPTAHLPRAPGTSARMLSTTQRARDCFPMLSVPAALRRYREVLDAPAVRRFIADFRALELTDALEQRGKVRENLHVIIDRGTAALAAAPEDGGLSPALAPNEWARVAATVTAACKVLVDLDGLAVRPEETAALVAPLPPEEDASDQDALLARVATVAEDMQRRRAAAPA